MLGPFLGAGELQGCDSRGAAGAAGRLPGASGSAARGGALLGAAPVAGCAAQGEQAGLHIVAGPPSLRRAGWRLRCAAEQAGKYSFHLEYIESILMSLKPGSQ